MSLRNELAAVQSGTHKHTRTHTHTHCKIYATYVAFLSLPALCRFMWVQNHKLGDRFTQKAPLGKPSSFLHFPPNQETIAPQLNIACLHLYLTFFPHFHLPNKHARLLLWKRTQSLISSDIFYIFCPSSVLPIEAMKFSLYPTLSTTYTRLFF